MNIFVLSSNPIVAAQMQCDKHVIKMVLESAQILSTVMRMENLVADVSALYKPTHQNHPCTQWAVEPNNFAWLVVHAKALELEYTHRYQRKHKSKGVIDIAWNRTTRHFDYLRMSQSQKTRANKALRFVQAMPEEYRTTNAVTAYRNYYYGEKRYMARWEKTRPAPPWWEARLKEEAKTA